MPNDPFADEQWALRMIRAESAWTVSKGASVVVAVVDSGVDLSHPDLRGKLLAGRDFVDGGTPPDDENGHGTHMAGTIAAVTGNGEGIAAVAPSAKILPVRVLNEKGKGEANVVRDGIEWAVDNGADVVNLSLAEDGPGQTEPGLLEPLLGAPAIDEGIRYAASRGAVVVIAAGNDDNGGRSQTSYDATVEGALVVGASTSGDRRAAYSNYGDGLDVLAPGGGSASDPDRNTGCTRINAIVGLYKGSAYAYSCGTSVSVAVVSGVAALLVARGLDNASVVNKILETAVDLGPGGPDAQTGHGRVDAAAAVGARPGSGRTSPTKGATASPSPRSPGSNVGGAGATPTGSASPSRSPAVSPLPSEPNAGPAQAAPPTRPAPDADRGVPISIATALAVFAAWGHRLFGGARVLGGNPAVRRGATGR